MRGTYKFLAYAIAVLVVVQAGAIAWAFFGLTSWIDNEGGVVDKAYLECTDCESFGAAELGFAIHMFFVGFVLMQLLALIMLITSFFAKIPGGVKWAAVVAGLIILQIWVLPMLSREVGSGFGALHGINALVLMGVAAMAARRVDTTATTDTDSTAPVTA